MTRRRPAYALLAALAGVVALAIVRLVAFSGPGRAADQLVLGGFLDLRGPRTDALALAVAKLADPTPFLVLGAVLVAVALGRRRPRTAIAVVVALAGANLTTQLLKPLLATPRASGSLASVLGPIDPSSWPSGHATASMSLALAAVLVASPRRRPLVALLGAGFSIAVCYSLLTLGWHYPSDVLGGFVVAATWIALALAGLRAAQARAPARAARQAALRLRDALAPTLVGVLGAGGMAVLVALARPQATLDFARVHTTFVAGAAVIGALGLALVAGLATTLGREPR